MSSEYEQIILDLGGEILPPNDARRPNNLKIALGVVGLLPTGNTTTPNLVLHLSPTFPWGTPDVYLPPDKIVGVRPHVDYRGIICSRAYRVFANPSRPKEVMQQVMRETVAVLEQTFTEKERLDHFLGEAQAYWSQGDPRRLHFFPSLLDHTFVFQCTEKKIHKETVFVTDELSSAPEIIGMLIEVPPEEVEPFLTAPETWLQSNEPAQLRLREGLDALNRLNDRPKRTRAILCFRIGAPDGNIILPAYLSGEIKLRKLLGHHHQNQWVQLFHQQAEGFIHLVSEDLSSARIIRRAIGKNQAASGAFASINDTRMAVVGCGSLGSHIVDLVIQAGIQRLYLVDNDLLMPENFARHTLPGIYCYAPKVEGLLDKARLSFPESRIDVNPHDIRIPRNQDELVNWGASLVLCAAADLNVEMLLSELSRKGSLPSCWFCWVEPQLSAGHLVFQPAESNATLPDLYEKVGDDWLYRHRVSVDGPPAPERECGCQTTFTPFSGVDAALFSALCVREILKHIETPLGMLTAFRWKPESNMLETMR
ncbi:MAG: ThiF family adenylyltransferase [Methylacidiphilales bacterium]|nr:ThiF family adenylyltransferase [Candidatus Methylacidiphilales bacterium]